MAPYEFESIARFRGREAELVALAQGNERIVLVDLDTVRLPDATRG